LAGLVDIETFLARVQPRKRFRNLYWGRDLIDALDGPLIEHPEAAPRKPCVAMEVNARRKEETKKNSSGQLGRLNPADYRNLR